MQFKVGECNLAMIIITGIIIISIVNFIEMCKIKKRYKIFKGDTKDENLEMLLQKYIQLANNIQTKNLDLENEIKNIQNSILTNIQKVGITKYNAFEDMSNNLSFSLALLDGNNTGVILTQLYLRNSSTVYIRKIENGNCEIELSNEEKAAIKMAQNIQ